MSFYNYLSEHTILKISDIIFDRSINRNFDLLMKSQWWSEDELISYQNQKLHEIVYHAYHNVPYYKEVFTKTGLNPEDIKTKEDLWKIPILTKEEIRKNFPDKILAGNVGRNDYIITGSSGSTGEPLKYHISKEAYSMNMAAKIRGWYWMGYRLGDKFVKLSQNPRKKFEKKLQDFINRDKYLHVQHLTKENFERIINELRIYRPKIIRGYPDPLMFLAKYLQQNGIKDIVASAINTTGNILFPEARNLIESQFGCKIFDSYNSEAGAVAFECETHKNYHLAMEYAITEIINEGTEVKPGEKGRLITTDLKNFAMPFIRYDSQDIVTMGEKECSCGRKHKTISRIEGRDNDILMTPSGKYLIVHNFTGYFQRVDTPAYGTVEQFQVIQQEKDYIIINIVKGKGFSEEIKKKILDYWEKYIGDDVFVTVNVVEQIPLTPSGKRRFLIRNPEISLS